MHVNPAIDLDESPEIGLLHLFNALNGNLLVVAFDVRWELGDYTQVMGMLLTRPPEVLNWHGVPLSVYQVTRSGVRPYAKGLGPRLYEYAMLVISEQDPTGVLKPDAADTLSADAQRVWREFDRRGWGLGDDLYAYHGAPHLTSQLLTAQSRGEQHASSLAEPERFFWSKALDTYSVAAESRRANPIELRRIKNRLLRE